MSKFWWSPWFPAPHNTCLKICNTVYLSLEILKFCNTLPKGHLYTHLNDLNIFRICARFSTSNRLEYYINRSITIFFVCVLICMIYLSLRLTYKWVWQFIHSWHSKLFLSPSTLKKGKNIKGKVGYF